MLLFMQKNAIERRLCFYESVIPIRQFEYGQHKLTKIVPRLKRALRKIEEGSYGICESCEEDIPQERLEIIPGALFCVSCQEVDERRSVSTS